MLRRIEDEVTREWKKILYNEELYDLYCLLNIFRIIKSIRRWERHMACMG
jgi:hypothetical protein